MSPEQARGLPVDTRTDVWAFGCVLYEILTGRPAFEKPTTTDTLAAIVSSEPDSGRLPATIPPRVRELLGRCLAKDLGSRLRDIGDARLELDASELESPHSAPQPATSPTREKAWMAVAAVNNACRCSSDWLEARAGRLQKR